MTLTRPRLALVGVVSLVALSGCSGGASSGSPTADAVAGGSSVSSSVPRAAAGLADTGTKAEDTASLVEQKAVIRNGDIVLHTTDPQQARTRVDALLTRLHGSIDDEQTVYDKKGVIRDSRLVLRVPVASFPAAMDALEQLGTVVHSAAAARTSRPR